MRSVLFYVILFLLMPVHAIASVGVYADKQNLTASEVLALDSFEYPEKIRSFGETKDYYWLLFDDLKILENQQFWLFLDNSALDHIQTFRVSPLNEIEPIHDVGDAFPFAKRPIFHRTFLLPFTLNQQDRILIRIWGETPLAFRYKMGPSNEIFPQVSTREGIIKVMYGMILSLLFYNLIMFVITRIAVYGWYVVYMGGVVLFLLLVWGLAFSFYGRLILKFKMA